MASDVESVSTCMVSLIYPLVNIQKTIENGPVEIVDLPIENGDL
jgi:hypothetical protein